MKNLIFVFGAFLLVLGGCKKETCLNDWAHVWKLKYTTDLNGNNKIDASVFSQSIDLTSGNFYNFYPYNLANGSIGYIGYTDQYRGSQTQEVKEKHCNSMVLIFRSQGINMNCVGNGPTDCGIRYYTR